MRGPRRDRAIFARSSVRKADERPEYSEHFFGRDSFTTISREENRADCFLDVGHARGNKMWKCGGLEGNCW